MKNQKIPILFTIILYFLFLFSSIATVVSSSNIDENDNYYLALSISDSSRSTRDIWVDNFQFDSKIEKLENVKIENQDIVLSKHQFVLSSTQDFDNGTLLNIETKSNWSEIPENEFRIKQKDIILFQEDFEGIDGTNLIGYNNWYSYMQAGTYEAKIKNDQTYNGLTSGRLYVILQSGHDRDRIQINRPIDPITDEKIIYHLRISKTKSRPTQNPFYTYCSQGNEFVKMNFDNDNNIYFFNGNTKTNSGFSYKENIWYQVTIQHNFNHNTYNIWLTGDIYNNQLIVNKANRMKNGGNNISEIGLGIYTIWSDAGGYNWWDDIVITDKGFHQSGIWESNTIELNCNKSILDTFIEFKNVFQDKCEIDRIEWLENGIIKAAYNKDIEDSTKSPITITENDLTLGSFNDIIKNFTIKVFLVGDGENSPIIQKIGGNLRYLTGHIISTPIELNQNYCWNELRVTKTTTPDTDIKVSVLNGITDKYIPGFENLSNTFINLSTIDSKTFPVIKLRADFFGSTSFSPILQEWSVSWKEDFPGTTEIPSTYSLPEDTEAKHLIDLGEYFHDYYDPIENLTFKLIHQSNKKHLEAMADGQYLDFSTKLIDWTGTETFQVECTDTGGLKTNSNEFEVTVTPVNDAPYWKEIIPDLKLDEDTSKEAWLDLDNFAADIEDDFLDFRLISRSDQVNISININAENKITIIPKHNYFGKSNATIQVFESGNKDFYANDTFDITVLPINDPPVISPEISDQIINEDYWLNFTITASDPDLDVNFTFKSNISRANFNLEPYSGKLSFHPNNDDVGILFVNISVEDEGGLKDYDEFKLTINNVNDPPTDPTIASPEDHAKFKTNELVEFQAGICQDIDSGDTITYSWDFDFSNGLQQDKLGLEVNYTYKDPGKYIVTLTISDGTIQKSTFIVINITSHGPTNGNGETNGDGKDSEADYFLIAMIIIIIIVILVLIISAFIFSRKKRKSILSKYLDEIEQAYDWARTNPTVGKEKLSSIKTRLPNELKEGRLDTQSYNLLENKLNDYMHLLGMRVAGAAPGQIPMAEPFKEDCYVKPTTPKPPQADYTPTKVTPVQLKSEPPAFSSITPEILKLTDRSERCSICLGTIKTGLLAIRCECGKLYHDSCGRRVGECPGCNRKFNFKEVAEPTLSTQQSAPGAKKSVVKCFNCGNLVTVTIAPDGEPTIMHCPKCGQDGTM